MQSCVQKHNDVQSSLESLAVCENWRTLYKTGSLLNWNRVLGLALEQALLWFVATGTAALSVKSVLVRKVTQIPEGGASFCIAVELSEEQQWFIEDVANTLFQTLLDRNFMCTVGVDVPYTAVGGKGATRHHDILGTFCAGETVDFVGVSSIEVFLTKGSWTSAAVSKKKKETANNFTSAGPLVQRQMLCAVQYKETGHGLIGLGAEKAHCVLRVAYVIIATKVHKQRRNALSFFRL